MTLMLSVNLIVGGVSITIQITTNAFHVITKKHHVKNINFSKILFTIFIPQTHYLKSLDT